MEQHVLAAQSYLARFNPAVFQRARLEMIDVVVLQVLTNNLGRKLQILTLIFKIGSGLVYSTNLL